MTFANLRDYHVEDCTGCTYCSQGMFMKGENVGCVLKDWDDRDRLMQAMFENDTILFSAPTYDLQVSANFTRFMQRSLAYETAFLEQIGAAEGAFCRDPRNLGIVREKIGRYKAMEFKTV